MHIIAHHQLDTESEGSVIDTDGIVEFHDKYTKNDENYK